MTEPGPGPRRGFTLTEILTVAVLMAVLVAISARGFAGARDRANNSQVESNVRQVELGLQAYHADFDKFPAFLSRNASNAREDPQVLLNPLFNRQYIKGNTLPPTPWRPSVFQVNELTPFTNAAAGIWTLTAARTSGRPIALPLRPETLGRGRIPTAAAGGQVFVGTATNVTYGALFYETNRGSANRSDQSLYVLYGVGKRQGQGLVVGLGTNLR
ncbi:MAG: type II secretion system protein [Candidatus Sericytochromatia bacterium]|nr:type II secretion system protein [Candidatus Sericytochromatia bacterium]